MLTAPTFYYGYFIRNMFLISLYDTIKILTNSPENVRMTLLSFEKSHFSMSKVPLYDP